MHGEDRNDGGLWVVDPVDGTVNFAHALPLFAISIGYEVNGRAEAGVVIRAGARLDLRGGPWRRCDEKWLADHGQPDGDRRPRAPRHRVSL